MSRTTAQVVFVFFIRNTKKNTKHPKGFHKESLSRKGFPSGQDGRKTWAEKLQTNSQTALKFYKARDRVDLPVQKVMKNSRFFLFSHLALNFIN